MINLAIIMKLAGLGISITLINEILEKVNAKEWKFPVSVVGIVMALTIVAQYIVKLFQVVQTFAN